MCGHCRRTRLRTAVPYSDGQPDGRRLMATPSSSVVPAAPNAPVTALFALPVAVGSIVALSTILRLHPFFSLFVPAVVFGALFMSPEASLDAFTDGVGRTTGGVGVIILCGSVIGAFLDRTDAVTSIAQSILRAVGDAHSLFAMSLVGFMTSIPVFADAAFIVLCPVINDIIRKGGHPTAHFALALGLATSHTMVPPTPGPVFAAAALQADLGLVAAAGSLVAISSCIVATLFCFAVSPPSLLDGVSGSAEVVGTASASDTEAAVQQRRRTRRRGRPPPELWRALLPIVLPMALIGVGSISAALEPLGTSDESSGGGRVTVLMGFMGRAEIALCAGIAAAYLLLSREKIELSVEGTAGEGVAAAAPIILITAAGGGFGRVITETGVGAAVADMLSNNTVGQDEHWTDRPVASSPAEVFSVLIPMALAAALKTAQGSGTVAITLTASLVAPLVPPSVTGWERALVVVAIGAGSLCVIHVNDSFFWVRNPISLGQSMC